MSVSFKRKLIATTTLAVALIGGYARRSYAAGCVTGSPPTYLCNAYYSSTVAINANDAYITTTPGFTINTTGSGTDALTVTGDGSLTFIDTTGSTIRGSKNGISIANTDAVSGSINIDSNSEIIAENFGFGVLAINYAAAGSSTITISGQMTSYSAPLIGVYNIAASSTADINVNLLSSAQSYDGAGISTFTTGGNISIHQENSSLTTQQTAILARNQALGEDISFTSLDSGIFASQGNAIDLLNSGTGDTELNLRNVNAYGYFTGAFISAGNTTGDVRADIDNSQLVSAATGSVALNIDAQNNGRASINVYGSSTISGQQGGIRINDNSTGNDLIELYAHEDSAVIAQYGSAIGVYNNSNKNVVMTLNGDVLNYNNIGIISRNSGSGDINITTGTDSFIYAAQGTAMELSISGAGTGGIDVQHHGKIESYSYGLHAVTEHSALGDVSINIDTGSSVSSVSNYASALYVRNDGNGGLAITVSGDVTGQTGISIRNRGNAATSGIIINGNAKIEGAGGTAINFLSDIYFGYTSYSTAATPIEIAGGRIIGDVVDLYNGLGFSPVTVTGNFTSEGNFRVSDFNVASGGHFTLGANNVITNHSRIDIAGTFTAGGTGASVTGDLDVGNTGDFYVNEDFSIGGVFSNNGHTSIATGKTLTVDTMAAGTGQLSFGFNTDTDHALLTVLNGAADLSGQYLYINVTGVTGLSPGQQALLVSGNGSLIGDPGSTPVAVADSSALWDFRVVNGNGAPNQTTDGDLFLVADQSAPISDLAWNSNNEAAANTLMGLQGTTNPELAGIVANMNGASTQYALNEVLEAIQPVADLSDAATMGGFSRHAANIAGTRLSDLRQMSGGTESVTWLSQNHGIALPQTRGLQAWVSRFGDQNGDLHGLEDTSTHHFIDAFGSYGRQQARGGIDGYTATSGGATFGLDTGKSYSDLVLGVSVGYTHANIRSGNANKAKNEINGFNLMAYASKKLSDDAYLDLHLLYGRNENNTTRHNVGGTPGLTAKADYTSSQTGIRTVLGRDIKTADGFRFMPRLSLEWLHYNAEDYTETGAGGGNLSVNTKSLDSLELGGAVTLAKDIKRDNGAIIQPQVTAGYFYDLIGDPLVKTSAFTGGGSAFTTQSADPSRHRVSLGAGITYHTVEQWAYSLNYEANLRQDYQDHSLLAKIHWKF